MQFTPLGPWGVSASAGPVAADLKVDSGRVADPKRAQRAQGGKGVKEWSEILV